MNNMKYNLLTLLGFLISALTEFYFREGGGFTLTAFIFYGLIHLIRTGMYLIKIHEDDQNN